MDSIGRYRLVRRLGAGSFATVWLGHDDDLDVPVAVKVLAENWSANADVRQRFLGEARILRRIRDPRIVPVYDIGSLPDGRPYFVMDFVDGGSLEDLRRTGPPPPATALRLCAQGCRAIDVLHGHHVIHRDVTPGNLLIQRTGDSPGLVVLADLGVAKTMVETSELTMTAGTPAFMAPEQAAGGALDRRVDVYSLTAVAYTLISGTPPFLVRTVADVVNRDQSMDPPPLAAHVGAPPSLDTVLSAGLAYQPDRRPPTAALLADALDAVATELERSPERSVPPSGRSTLRAPESPDHARSPVWGGPADPYPRHADPAGPSDSSPSGVAAIIGPPNEPSRGRPAGAQPPHAESPHAPPRRAHLPSPASPNPSSPNPSSPSPSSPDPRAPTAGSSTAFLPEPPNPSRDTAVGWSAPAVSSRPPTHRRSTARFVVLVIIACIILFSVSLFVTVMALRG